MRSAPEVRVKPPGPKAQEILKLEEKFLSPSYTRPYPLVVERAEGVWVYDVDGNRYLDFNAGIAVVSTGHRHPLVIEAVKKQLDKFIHYSLSNFCYEEAVLLARKLAEIVPGAMNKRVFFTNSGSEAIEASMKLSRYMRGGPVFLAFEGAFHGRTFGALSLSSSKIVHKKRFPPFLPNVVTVPFPNPYRPPLGADSENVGDAVIDYIENTIFKRIVSPDDVSAFFIEPIQGEGGYIVPPKDFFKKLSQLLRKYDILLVDDEIQAGMGRTGFMFAIEHFGVIPDIVVVAKGIASGFPLGAMVSRASLMGWERGAHGSTFGGNPVSIRAALATISLLEEGLVENAERVGKFLKEGLLNMMHRFDFIGDVRGLGLMVGVEIVEDRERKTPSKKLRDRIITECFRRGLLLLGGGESVIRFSPPLIVTEEEVARALEIFEDVLSKIREVYHKL